MSAHLELGHIPRRVLVRRTLNVTKWRLVRGNFAVNVKRELNLRTVSIGDAMSK